RLTTQEDIHEAATLQSEGCKPATGSRMTIGHTKITGQEEFMDLWSPLHCGFEGHEIRGRCAIVTSKHGEVAHPQARLACWALSVTKRAAHCEWSTTG